MSEFSGSFIKETHAVLDAIDPLSVERVAEELGRVRERDGRLFIIGVGGSAGHASHAVNDFRKICGFEAYTPTDNVSELTARINDDGWDSCYEEWLKGSRL
ncbi:MAG: SIS domain-containing protein, partial [Candidatus Dormibacteraeota bacterium]|nr:SIS domain-containing protein [Candidatus Dormibacteraeota bacterium]